MPSNRCVSCESSPIGPIESQSTASSQTDPRIAGRPLGTRFIGRLGNGDAVLVDRWNDRYLRANLIIDDVGGALRDRILNINFPGVATAREVCLERKNIVIVRPLCDQKTNSAKFGLEQNNIIFKDISRLFRALSEIHKENRAHGNVCPSVIHFASEFILYDFAIDAAAEEFGDEDIGAECRWLPGKAPELWNHPGKATAAGDVYSTAAAAGYLIFGDEFFRDAIHFAVDGWEEWCRTEGSVLPGITIIEEKFGSLKSNIVQLWQKALHKDVEKRTVTALELSLAFQEAAEELERRPLTPNILKEQKPKSSNPSTVHPDPNQGPLIPEELDGHSFAGYKIDKKLGQGGMGCVYDATKIQSVTRVAFKVLPSKLLLRGDSVRRFGREADALLKVKHPNIVRAFERGQHENIHFLTMEYIEGVRLSKIVTFKSNNLPKEKWGNAQELRATTLFRDNYVLACIEVIITIAEAAHHVHTQSLIHRDITPNNIILKHDTTPILIDFGLVREKEQSSESGTGFGPGTLGYKAPEQDRGDANIDGRADIFSLGAVLFELLTLHPLPEYSGERWKPPSALAYNPKIPRALDNIIIKALAPNAKDRYGMSGEFAAALKSILKTPPEALLEAEPTVEIAQKVGEPGHAAGASQFLKTIPNARAAGSIATKDDGPPPRFAKLSHRFRFDHPVVRENFGEIVNVTRVDDGAACRLILIYDSWLAFHSGVREYFLELNAKIQSLPPAERRDLLQQFDLPAEAHSLASRDLVLEHLDYNFEPAGEWVKSERTPQDKDVVRIIRLACAAVADAHGHGIVHGGISLNSIGVGGSVRKPTARILNFTQSKIAAAEQQTAQGAETTASIETDAGALAAASLTLLASVDDFTQIEPLPTDALSKRIAGARPGLRKHFIKCAVAARENLDGFQNVSDFSKVLFKRKSRFWSNFFLIFSILILSAGLGLFLWALFDPESFDYYQKRARKILEGDATTEIPGSKKSPSTPPSPSAIRGWSLMFNGKNIDNKMDSSFNITVPWNNAGGPVADLLLKWDGADRKEFIVSSEGGLRFSTAGAPAENPRTVVLSSALSEKISVHPPAARSAAPTKATFTITARDADPPSRGGVVLLTYESAPPIPFTYQIGDKPAPPEVKFTIKEGKCEAPSVQIRIQRKESKNPSDLTVGAGLNAPADWISISPSSVILKGNAAEEFVNIHFSVDKYKSAADSNRILSLRTEQEKRDILLRVEEIAAPAPPKPVKQLKVIINEGNELIKSEETLKLGIQKLEEALTLNPSANEKSEIEGSLIKSIFSYALKLEKNPEQFSYYKKALALSGFSIEDGGAKSEINGAPMLIIHSATKTRFMLIERRSERRLATKDRPKLFVRVVPPELCYLSETAVTNEIWNAGNGNPKQTNNSSPRTNVTFAAASRFAEDLNLTLPPEAILHYGCEEAKTLNITWMNDGLAEWCIPDARFDAEATNPAKAVFRGEFGDPDNFSVRKVSEVNNSRDYVGFRLYFEPRLLR